MMKELFNKLKTGPAIAVMVAIALGYQILQARHNASLLRSAKYVGTTGPAPSELIGTVAANAPDAPGNKTASLTVAPPEQLSEQPLTQHEAPPQIQESAVSWDSMPKTNSADVDQTNDAAVNAFPTATINVAPKAVPLNGFSNYASSDSTQSRLPAEVQSLINQPAERMDPNVVIRRVENSAYGPRVLYIKTATALMRFQIAKEWTLSDREWESLQKKMSFVKPDEENDLTHLKTSSLYSYNEKLDENDMLSKDFAPNEEWFIESAGDSCDARKLKHVQFTIGVMRGKCMIGKLVSYYQYDRHQKRAKANLVPKFFSTSNVQESSSTSRSPASIATDDSSKREWYERNLLN